MAQTDTSPTVADLAAELDALRDEVSDLRDENEQLRDDVNELQAENDALRDQLDAQVDRIEWHNDIRNMENLRIDGIPVGRALEKRREEINALQDAHDTRTEQPDTELGVGLAMDDDARSNTYGATKQRALAVADVLPAVAGEEGARVGSDLKHRVENVRSESLAWVQLYRACEAVETMSEGAIEWDNTGETNYLHIHDASVLR